MSKGTCAVCSLVDGPKIDIGISGATADPLEGCCGMPGCRAIAGVAGGGGGPLLLELVLVVSGCAAFGGKPKFFAIAAFGGGNPGGPKLGNGKAGFDVCC